MHLSHDPWIEYREGPQFIEYIRRSELKSTLERRIQEASTLLWSKSSRDIAKYLCIIHNKKQDLDWYLDLLNKHTQKLVARYKNLT